MLINKKQKGFTLIETMITVGIFTIIMLGTTLMLRDIFYTSRQQYGVLDNTDQARRIANSFINEIRNSAYGANGSYPIGQAADNQLIFYSLDPATGKVLRIRYFINGNTLSKGTVTPTGTPAIYVLGNEVVKVLSTKLSQGASPLFYYYDGSYTGTGNALTQPVNVNQVKFIKMNLTVLKELVKNSTTTFTVSAGGAMRNLKTNLGN